MIKQFKNYHITADTHFGHKFVANLRGFDTVEEHDKFLVDRFSSRLGEKSTLIIVGDAALSARGLAPLGRIPGRKILYAGNHCLPWHRRSTVTGVKRALRAIPAYSEYFSEIVTAGTGLLRFDGDKTPFGVVISHLPVEGDHQDEDRYQDMRPNPGELPVLCGHVHSAWRTKGRQLNVGVDVNNFLPLTLNDAINEAISLDGIGASPVIAKPGPWFDLGLA